MVLVKLNRGRETHIILVLWVCPSSILWLRDRKSWNLVSMVTVTRNYGLPLIKRGARMLFSWTLRDSGLGLGDLGGGLSFGSYLPLLYVCNWTDPWGLGCSSQTWIHSAASILAPPGCEAQPAASSHPSPAIDCSLSKSSCFPSVFYELLFLKQNSACKSALFHTVQLNPHVPQFFLLSPSYIIFAFTL